MTAEVCEGEAESKRATACGSEPNGGVPVGAEGRPKGGFKARGREETNPTVRTLEIVRGKLAGQIPRVGVLKTLREDPKDIAEQIRRELDTQFAASDALRTPESDGDGRREDGAEDHYEEGDAAAACAKPPAPQASKEPVEATMPRVQEGGGWESFLLQRNLRVLLVEDDDSTRHVVGALLRNCNYEVTAVANGLMAWELLEDAKSHFDLVLTDVVMPCLSGVGLLSKMMKREACKRVPIVIMSSYDSLDIVFRCLSKGAADYLVKPVRKNELRNLWQHVWRKCHSSSGSRSGSGSQTGEVVRPEGRGVEAAENASESNDGSDGSDGSDNGNSRLNVRGGSDNGSGNQVCMQPVLVPRNNVETGAVEGDEEGQATSQKKGTNLDDEMGHDLEMATRRPGGDCKEKDEQVEGVRKQQGEDAACVMQDDGPSPCGGNGESPSSSGPNGTAEESSPEAIDLINGIAGQPQVQTGGVEEEEVTGDGDEELDQMSPKANRSGSDSGPMLELSLKRPRSAVEHDGELEERQPLRHSGGSAFSRYSTGGGGTIIQQYHPGGSALPPSGYPMSGGFGAYSMSPGNCGTSGGSLRLAMGFDRSGSSKGSVEGTTPPPVHVQSGEKQSGQEAGQDGYNKSRQSKEEAMLAQGVPLAIPIPPPGMLAYDGSFGPAMHPMYYAHLGPWMAAAASVQQGDVYNQSSAFPEQSSGTRHSNQHTHHHQASQHHHHHHHHGSQPAAVQDEQQQSVITPGSGAPRSGSANIVTGESGSGYGSTGNGNGSMNGSASGSNTGVNNGQSGLGVGPMANDNCGNDPAMDGASGGNGVCTEQMRFARREAALNKFRQKRKERCFEKKVRYQSRKKLAEQRPRVRGQFVRQAVYDPAAGDAE